MQPTPADFQIFNDIKQVCLELNLEISNDCQEEFCLFFGARFPDGIPTPYEFIVTYHLKAQIVSLRSYLPYSVSTERKSDLLEILNYVNYHTVNTNFLISPYHPWIELNGLMELFDDPFNRENFKKYFISFLSPLCFLFPMIDSYLKGEIKKDELMSKFEEEMDFQEIERRSEEYPVC